MVGGIAFTGGGTGGHVVPGIAVIESIRSRYDGPIVWIGSRRGIEREIVGDYADRLGIEYVAIPAGKLRRYLSWENASDAFRVGAALLRSISLLKQRKPRVLFSKGGFVSVPPTVAAWLQGVPALTHESDADPGLATRINARFCRFVCVPYESTAARFGRGCGGEAIVTGNPVRRSVLAGDAERGRRLIGASKKQPVVFVLGGSLGSREINRLVDGARAELLRHAAVVHQRGTGNEALPAAPGGEGVSRGGLEGVYFARSYFREELSDLLAAADLVVSRAGAGSLWEAAALRKPMLLLPLDRTASRGDQIRNAHLFESAGAARVRFGRNLTPDGFAREIVELLGAEELRRRMSEATAEFSAEAAADKIADIVLQAGGVVTSSAGDFGGTGSVNTHGEVGRRRRDAPQRRGVVASGGIAGTESTE